MDKQELKIQDGFDLTFPFQSDNENNVKSEVIKTVEY